MAILRHAEAIISLLHGHPRDEAFAGCALAAFLILRGPTSLDTDLALIEELKLWIQAHTASPDHN